MARDDRDARGGHKQPAWKFDPCGCYWCDRAWGKRDPYDRASTTDTCASCNEATATPMESR